MAHLDEAVAVYCAALPPAWATSSLGLPTGRDYIWGGQNARNARISAVRPSQTSGENKAGKSSRPWSSRYRWLHPVGRPDQWPADPPGLRRGADLLLQVRCAIYSGTLGAGFGYRFDRIANADLAFAKASWSSR
jgi:hypothetical protein